MSNDAFDFKDKGLKDLIRILNESAPYAKVGVISSSKNAQRSNEDGSSKTNAEIGADHEFGTEKLPQRSFLRIPIAEQMQKILDKSGYLDKDTFNLIL